MEEMEDWIEERREDEEKEKILRCVRGESV